MKPTPIVEPPAHRRPVQNQILTRTMALTISFILSLSTMNNALHGQGLNLPEAGIAAPVILPIDNDGIDRRVDQLIGLMTLEEKASMCSGRDDWSSQSIDRLGIPWIWMADGPHGLRRAPQTNKPGYGDQLPATCFPTASALASTWNTDLIRRTGVALGEECQALDVNIILGPGTNIKRSPLGGRNFEYFSEDPVLAGEMAAAYITGVQSQGVGTSLKHFAANNTETNRMYMNSDVDNRTLHDIYLLPMEIAVKKAQPWTVMACYNRVQGEYGTQSSMLLKETLVNDWGFDGVVISDWFSVIDRVKGLKAGMHIEMPGLTGVNDALIVEAVQSGTLRESTLDSMVSDILHLVLKAHSLEKDHADQHTEAHHQLAREVAGEAITLLRNDHNILPVSGEKGQKIAIIGEFATHPRYQGNGSSEVRPTRLDSFMGIVEDEFKDRYTFAYAHGYSLADEHDRSLMDEAVRIAADNDIVIIFAGLPQSYETEGIDRTHIDLPEVHNELIHRISAVNNHVVVVLTNGSAVAMPWVNEVDAIVEGWLGGQAGAGAMADVLFGRINPSGKLAETFPVRLEDNPTFLTYPGENGNALYGERIFVGYRYYDQTLTEPLFPFGHGLSYTTFEYGPPGLSHDTISGSEALTLRMTIRNTGPMTGKEVVQLYMHNNSSGYTQPVKELKKFQKVELKPGEEKVISFTIDGKDLAWYNDRVNTRVMESGDYELLMGASSADIRQKATFHYTSEQRLPLNFDEYTFFTEYWKYPETREYLKKIMPNWIRGYVAPGHNLDEAEFQAFFVEQPIIKYPYLSYGECTAEQIHQLIRISQTLTFTP